MDFLAVSFSLCVCLSVSISCILSGIVGVGVHVSHLLLLCQLNIFWIQTHKRLKETFNMTIQNMQKTLYLVKKQQ